MPLPPKYGEQVYAGVLGKVIGVYLGRPFEGWDRKALEAKWGLVDRYVHEDQGVPLVVSDDDISGTFTLAAKIASGSSAVPDSSLDGETTLTVLISSPLAPRSAPRQARRAGREPHP